eukprot:SAG11_NODE_10310_length_840_cov_1.568151_1_plen_22_part_10
MQAGLQGLWNEVDVDKSGYLDM